MNTTLVKNIERSYEQKFNDKPILISSPGRINIIGEHTDYNEGFVFPAAIDKGIIAAIGKSNTFTKHMETHKLQIRFVICYNTKRCMQLQR